MQLATLKTLSQLEAVSKEIESRGWSKKKSEKLIFEIKIYNFFLCCRLSCLGVCFGHRPDAAWTVPVGGWHVSGQRHLAKRISISCKRRQGDVCLFYH
jgi:hypothetical protein